MANSETIDTHVGRTMYRLINEGRTCRHQDELTDQIEQSIDQSWTVDHEQTGWTDSQTGHSNQASNISTNNTSPSESETSQSSLLDDEVKKVELFIKFDLSPDKRKELQRLDAQLHGLIKYLDTCILPNSQKKARRILLESSDYAWIDGLLWLFRIAKPKCTQHLDNYQLVHSVLPDTMIKAVIQLYHDSPMSGHAGITDTLDRVKEHYYVWAQ